MKNQPYAISSLLKASLVMPLLLSVVVFILLLVTDDYISTEDWDFISIIMLFFSGATYAMTLLFVLPLLCLLSRFVAINFSHIIVLYCLAGMLLGFIYAYASVVKTQQNYLTSPAIIVGTVFGLVMGSLFYAVLRFFHKRTGLRSKKELHLIHDQAD